VFVRVCVSVCWRGRGSSVEFYFKSNKVFVTYLDNIVGNGLIKRSHDMHGRFCTTSHANPNTGSVF
jgi:hypothetical protein